MKSISVGKNLAAGVETTVYTVPTGYQAQWNLMYLHNGGGNTKSITVSWTDKSENTIIKVFDAYTLSSKDYFKFDGGAYVVLEEGDTITMTSEAASSFYAICTFLLERV